MNLNNILKSEIKIPDQNSDQLKNSEKNKFLYKKRMSEIQKIIKIIKDSSLIIEDYVVPKISISGLYAEMMKYIVFEQTSKELYDLPDTAFVYIDDQFTTPRLVLKHIIKNNILKNKQNLEYEIINLKEIEVWINKFSIEYGWILELSTKKLSDINDKFNIIFVATKSISDMLNFNVNIDNNFNCHLDGKRYFMKLYKHMITQYKYLDVTTAFHTSCSLIATLLSDIKNKLKLDIRYRSFIPDIFLEKKNNCYITTIEPPYFSIKLLCGHDMSIIAILGQLVSVNKSKNCPICRKKFFFNFLHNQSIREEKNILLNGANKECINYLYTLIGKKANKLVHSNNFMIYPDHNIEILNQYILSQPLLFPNYPAPNRHRSENRRDINDPNQHIYNTRNINIEPINVNTAEDRYVVYNQDYDSVESVSFA
jgi:hypothetical protein